MPISLVDDFKNYKRNPSREAESFLNQLEDAIAADLWESAGGYWSEASIAKIRAMAVKQWAHHLQQDTREEYGKAWMQVVREFHQGYWGERPLRKKEKKEKTEEQRIFWELFSYIWILLQTALVTKTVVFYFGVKSAREGSLAGKIYLILAILFSVGSLVLFAIRRSKKDKAGNKNKVP